MSKRTVGPSRVALVHGHSSRIDCKSIAKMALPPGPKTTQRCFRDPLNTSNAARRALALAARRCLRSVDPPAVKRTRTARVGTSGRRRAVWAMLLGTAQPLAWRWCKMLSP